MSEVNCFNCCPSLSFEELSWENIKEGSCDYIKKAVVVTGDGIKKIPDAARFLGNKTVEIITIAAFDLFVTLNLMPFIQLFPPANSVFPAGVIKVILYTVTLPTIIFTHILTNLIPACNVTFSYGRQATTNLSKYLAVGLSEEIVFRGVIQQGVLRELPKLVLSKVAPDYVSTVDDDIARVARVIFSSAVFALAHAAAFGDSPGMLLPQFIGGLIYGGLVEDGHSILKLSLVHCVYDIAIVILVGGI